MKTNISNIIDGLINLIEQNREHIDSVINEYERGKSLHIFKGVRKSIPADLFPCLEIEPNDGSMSWQTTEHQDCQYSVEMILTISTTIDDVSVEYISTITREFLHLLNNPANMKFEIPNEKNWDPISNSSYQSRVEFGSVSNVSYNATKDGSIRVSRWTWTGQVRESYPREYDDYSKLSDSPDLPRQYPELGV